MKPSQFIITVVVGAICLLLSIVTIALGHANQNLQVQLQGQQQEVQRGNMSQQIGTNLVTDLANLSVSNPKIKKLLADNGFTVNVASPTPTPNN